MTHVSCFAFCASKNSWQIRRRAVIGAIAAAALVAGSRSTAAVGIQGTMSNFDVFNETGVNVYGAELDLVGIHATDVTRTYPSHFGSIAVTDYTLPGGQFGAKIVCTGYTFTANGYITPTTGVTTNGHYCVNLPGCEHFGYALSAQPTSTAYFWLDQNSGHVGSTAMTIPSATWTYIPAAGAQPAVIKAVIAPPPPPPIQLYPDAVWVKTYVTELTQPVSLDELISSPPEANGIVPQLPTEVETEWELLPGDTPLDSPDINLTDADQAVVRRYEFYKYTGGYDEVHLPTSAFTGGTPDPSELGQFIAANMVAANLAAPVPEPASLLVLGSGAMILLARRRR